MTVRKPMTKKSAEAIVSRAKGPLSGAVSSLMALLIADSAFARDASRENQKPSDVSASAEAELAALADAQPAAEQEIVAAAEGEVAEIEQAVEDVEAAAEQVAEAAEAVLTDEDAPKKPIKAVDKKVAKKAADDADAPVEKILLADAGSAASTTTTATDAGSGVGAGASAGAEAGVAGVTLGAIPIPLVLGGAVVVGAAAGGGGGGSNDSPAAATTTVTVVDGYVSGARVGWDKNGDGVIDEYASGTTNSRGDISISLGQEGWRLVAEGGTDTLTGKAVGKMIAANGSSVVTPLTTLVAAGNITEAQLIQKLGLNALGITNLRDYDPIEVMQSDTATAEQKAAALQVFEVSQQVMTIIQTAAAAAADARPSGTVTPADVLGIASAVGDALDNFDAGSNGLSDAEFGQMLNVATADALGAAGLAGADLATMQNAIMNAVTVIDNQITDAFIAAVDSGNTAVLGDQLDAVQFAQDQLIGAVLADGAAATALLEAIATSANALEDIADSIENEAPTAVTINEYTITDAQAAIQAAVDGATSADIVTLQGPAGTQLQTSLQKMGALGVDVVAGSMVGAEMHIGYGAGDLAAQLGGFVPGFNAADSVTVEFTDSQLDAVMEPEVGALAAGNVDFVGAADGSLSADQQFMTGLLGQGMAFDANDDVTLELANGTAVSDQIIDDLIASNVDIIDLMGNTGSLNEAQAAELVGAGVHFAADDTVTLNVDVTNTTEGTHLSTSIKEMAHLGVDVVTMTMGAGAEDGLHVHYGTGAIDTTVGVPQFNNAADVVVEFADSQVAGISNSFVQQLAASGVDVIGAVDASLVATEAQALALISAGLEFADADSITIAGQGTYLDNLSLKQLGDLGVDSFDTSAGGQTFEVEFGADWSTLSANELNTALSQLLDQFHPTEQSGDLQLFEAEDNVTLDLGNVDVNLLSDAVLHKAQLIGMDSVLGSDLDGNSIKDGKGTV